MQLRTDPEASADPRPPTRPGGGDRSAADARAAIDRENAEAYAARFDDPPGALEAALGIASRAGRLGYLGGFAYALRTAGAARCLTSQFHAALVDLRRARRIFTSLGDGLGIAHVTAWIGNVYVRSRGPSAGIPLYVAALKGFRIAGDESAEAALLQMLGNAHLQLGEIERALELFLECRRIAEAAGDLHNVARALSNIGAAYSDAGEYDPALDHFTHALKLAGTLGMVASEAITLVNLSIIHRKLGRFDDAFRAVTASLPLFGARGMRRDHAHALLEVAEVRAARGELREALEDCEAALRLATEAGERRIMLQARIDAGLLLLRVGDHDAAEGALGEALRAAVELGLPRAEFEAHRGLAMLNEAAGRSEGALRHYRTYHEGEARVLAAEASARRRAIRALEELERMQREGELQAVRSELQVLKAQMQPHFLLNALNSVAALLHRDPGAAEEMIGLIGELLRKAIAQSDRQEIEVREELDFLRAYLEVERIRLQSAIRVRIRAEPGVLGARIPNLILQPLVENAVHHAMRAGSRPLHLDVAVHAEGAGTLRVEVRDDGVGLPEGWSLRRAGVGLTNTRERLRLLYGGGHSFEVEPHPSGGTQVTLRIPLQLQIGAPGPEHPPSPGLVRGPRACAREGGCRRNGG